MDERTGANGAYSWLEVDACLLEFVKLCPEVVLGKWLVVTSVDSGQFMPGEAECAQGWIAAHGLAYSPRVDSLTMLPEALCGHGCCGCDEWYVFDAPPEPLGSLWHDNVFEMPIKHGQVFACINFIGFQYSSAPHEPIAELFWRQVEWMQPESHVGENNAGLLFATRNAALFADVCQRLAGCPETGSAIS
ncbi:MAG: hypothetical protein IT162_10460 [Bryobacterales bacterium]|nr:hypothetical protein [Bryobacterales bacterium]